MILPSNSKDTCIFYKNDPSELELHFRGTICTTPTEENLLVWWLGHCAMRWDKGLMPSLEMAENELLFSAFWPEDHCCCCHLRRNIGPPWVLLQRVLKKTQGNWWVSPGSTEPRATGQEMGRTSDPLLSSASPSSSLNSFGLLTAVKAVLIHTMCPAIAWSAYLPDSTWRLSFQESRHIKSKNLLRQAAELCYLSLPPFLIKSTIAEIMLAWYITVYF